MTGAGERDDPPRVWLVALRVADEALRARLLAALETAGAFQLAPATALDGADAILADAFDHGEGEDAALVLLTDDGALARRALAAGAAAVLPSRVGRGALIAAIEAAARGLVVADRHLVAPLGDGAPPAAGVAAAGVPELTAREREVLGLLAEGASNKAIARRLAISVHTVKFHVAAILDKLDATGRTDAVAHAVRLGLILL
jgi:DNA-binding NarL/FixJ family response regulator